MAEMDSFPVSKTICENIMCRFYESFDSPA